MTSNLAAEILTDSTCWNLKLTMSSQKTSQLKFPMGGIGVIRLWVDGFFEEVLDGDSIVLRQLFQPCLSNWKTLGSGQAVEAFQENVFGLRGSREALKGSNQKFLDFGPGFLVSGIIEDSLGPE